MPKPIQIIHAREALPTVFDLNTAQPSASHYFLAIVGGIPVVAFWDAAGQCYRSTPGGNRITFHKWMDLPTRMKTVLDFHYADVETQEVSRG